VGKEKTEKRGKWKNEREGEERKKGKGEIRLIISIISRDTRDIKFI
jgi:hypothetical protein